MSALARRVLWAMLLAGLCARVGLAFGSRGVSYDIDSWQIVRDALLSGSGLGLYGDVNADQLRFPYPPGFLPFILLGQALAKATGLAFHGFVQIGPIAADLAIAWVVQDVLGRAGASQGRRLAAAGLVALGPSFGLISGVHGQMDSLVALPALLGYLAWTRSGSERRWLFAGALIGLGACFKTTPLLVALALLPSARSWREGLKLALTAGAVPLAALAPFLAADFAGTRHSFEYNGVAGFGGISMLVQPSLADAWMTLRLEGLELNAASRALIDAGSAPALLALAVIAGLLLWLRPAPAHAVTIAWLTLYVLAPNFAFQYVVWGLPFFILAGHLGWVAAFQALLFVPGVLIYTVPHGDWAVYAYFPLMALAWAGALLALVLAVRSAARSLPVRPPGMYPSPST
ncbi:MAG TPA: glycosyltransferase 87 family protein [Thermoleophilaceae bacterium]|nr:glycosyltransferase 87 family protein [Thermoleophilaceae bacterium]